MATPAAPATCRSKCLREPHAARRHGEHVEGAVAQRGRVLRDDGATEVGRARAARPPWYHVCTTDPEALRVTRSTRPAADEAADGALVEVTPAPSPARPTWRRRRCCAARRPGRRCCARTTLTWVPVRASVTPEGETSVPAATRRERSRSGAIRTMRSLVPFDVVNHRAPSGPCIRVRIRPKPSACGERGDRDDPARAGRRVHPHQRDALVLEQGDGERAAPGPPARVGEEGGAAGRDGREARAPHRRRAPRGTW